MKPWSLVALWATVASASNHRERPHAHLHRRDTVGIGPSGTCPAVSTTITAYLQPVFYEEFFPYNSVIIPFRNGVPFTVSDAPTDVVITSTLTSLVTGSMVGSSSIASFSAGFTTSAPAASTGLAIGQGLPAGRVNNLADENFIFLAFTAFPNPTPAIDKREENIRRQAPSTTRPIFAVNLVQPPGALGGLSQDDCDSASPLLLRQGRLVQYALTVGKRVFEIAPLLGFPDPPIIDQVDATFSLVDGVLRWDATDLNAEATFFDCGGQIYAAFDTLPPGNCVPVIVGAIAGSICLDRVRQTRVPNPAFVAPIPASSSSRTTTNAISLPSSSSGPVVCRNANHPDPGAGICGCSYDYYCNEQVLYQTSAQAISSFDLINVNENYVDYCATQCDNNANCLSFLVSRSNSTCTIMDMYAYRIAPSDTSDYDYGQRPLSLGRTICQNPQCTTGFGPSNTTSSTSSSAPSPSTSLTDCQLAKNPTPETGACGCSYFYLCSVEIVKLDATPLGKPILLDSVQGNHMDYCALQCDNNFQCDSFLVSEEGQQSTCVLLDGGIEGYPNSSSVVNYGSRYQPGCLNPQCGLLFSTTAASTTLTSSSSSAPSPSTSLTDCQKGYNGYSSDGDGTGLCGCRFERFCYEGVLYFDDARVIGLFQLATIDENHMDYCETQCDNNADCQSYVVSRSNNTCTLMDQSPRRENYNGASDVDLGRKIKTVSGSTVCQNPQCVRYYGLSTSSTTIGSSTSTPASSTSMRPTYSSDCRMARNPYSPNGSCNCQYSFNCDTYGGIGRLEGTSTTISIADVTTNHVEYCAAQCDADADCKSFLINNEAQTCTLNTNYAFLPQPGYDDHKYDYGTRDNTCGDPQCCIRNECSINPFTSTVSSSTTTASTSSTPSSDPDTCEAATNPSPAGRCGCPYTYECNTAATFNGDPGEGGSYDLSFTNANPMDFCAANCDNNANCRSFSVSREQGRCVLYSRVADMTSATDADLDYGERKPGVCLNPQCSLPTSSTTATSSSLTTTSMSIPAPSSDASSSSAPPAPINDCSSTPSDRPGGFCGCRYNFYCNLRATYPSFISSFMQFSLAGESGNRMNACGFRCDSYTSCRSFVVDVAAQRCLLYSGTETSLTADGNFSYGERANSGTCQSNSC